MEHKSVRARDPCSHDNCGSRRFHLGNDGYTYCDQGHQQSELGTAVVEDPGQFGPLGKRHKRIDSEVESTTGRGLSLHGSRAFEHYLLCLQLVLRKQLRWLMDVQKFPLELEALVKDLWSLRTRELQARMPVPHDSDTEAETQSTQVYSSQSEYEAGTNTNTVKGAQKVYRRQREVPSPIELLSLTYIGILLLRIPMTVMDLHGMVNSGNLLYYRAAKEIPASMRDRLPGTYRDLLEPQNLIKPEVLYRTIIETASMFNTEFGMLVPPLNHALVLYRWTRELALPLEVYVATQRLADELDIDFKYSIDASATTRVNLRYPDIRLMALVIIATKLLFPFDDVRRYPTSGSDLSALDIDWHAWAAAQSEETESNHESPDCEPLSFEEAFSMSAADSVRLAGSRLDDYLLWYERNIASDEVRETGAARKDAEFRRFLFGMFPLPRERGEAQESPREVGPPPSRTVEKLVRVHSTLRSERTVPETVSERRHARAGSSYVQYRDPGELPWPADVFHQKAAAMAGWPLHGLVRAVFTLERRLHAADLDRREHDRGRSQT